MKRIFITIAMITMLTIGLVFSECLMIQSALAKDNKGETTTKFPVKVNFIEIYRDTARIGFSGPPSSYKPDCAKLHPFDNEMMFSLDAKASGDRKSSLLSILQAAQKNGKRVIISGAGECSLFPNLETIQSVVKEPDGKARIHFLPNSSVATEKESEEESQYYKSLRFYGVRLKKVHVHDGYWVAVFSFPASIFKPECAQNHPNEMTFNILDKTRGGAGELIGSVFTRILRNGKTFIVFGTGSCSHDPQIEALGDIMEVEE